jgi:hypothetical protein
MTLYAVLDPQGKMCSDACRSDSLARSSMDRYQQLRSQWINDNDSPDSFKDFIAQLGYTCAPVSVYDPETQVVVDKAAYRVIANDVYLDIVTGLHAWPDDQIDLVKQFLNAGGKT